MAALVAGLVIFGLLAVLVLTALDGDRDAEDLGGALTFGVWFTYLVHADTVATAAFLDVGRVPAPATPALVLGLAIAVVGFGLFVWSSRVLAGDGDFKGLASRRLVTRGPYALMRHPQDTGWAIMLLGVAVAGRSPIALALVALFVLFVDRLWRIDEQHLLRRFAEPWKQYAASTPRARMVPRRSGV